MAPHGAGMLVNEWFINVGRFFPLIVGPGCVMMRNDWASWDVEEALDVQHPRSKFEHETPTLILRALPYELVYMSTILPEKFCGCFFVCFPFFPNDLIEYENPLNIHCICVTRLSHFSVALIVMQSSFFSRTIEITFQRYLISSLLHFHDYDSTHSPFFARGAAFVSSQLTLHCCRNF